MSDPKQPGFEEESAPFDADLETPLPLTEDEEAALLEAEADADAGRVVPHERVKQWLQSIVDGKPEPPPFSWRK
jgi:hypothetical protein